MSSISRFKFQRPVPAGTQHGNPDFTLYSIKRMRQLASQVFHYPPIGGTKPLFTIYVPANSWAPGKSVIVRGLVGASVGVGVIPPSINIAETLAVGQAAPFLVGNATGFTNTNGSWYWFREFKLIRIDTQIWHIDMNSAYSLDGLTSGTNPQVIHPFPAIAPPYDYTTQIAISYEINAPTTIPLNGYQGIWAQGFLESGTNLGSLS